MYLAVNILYGNLSFPYLLNHCGGPITYMIIFIVSIFFNRCLVQGQDLLRSIDEEQISVNNIDNTFFKKRHGKFLIVK